MTLSIDTINANSNRLTLAAHILLIYIFLLSATAACAALDLQTSDHTSRTPVMQFSTAGHVVGFAPRAIMVSGADHLLEVRFIDARPVMPQSDGNSAPSKPTALKALPMDKVTYADLWPGISLVYDGTRGLLESIYHIAPDYIAPDHIAHDYIAPDYIAPDYIAPDYIAPDRHPPSPTTGQRSVDRIRLRYNAPVSLDGNGNLVIAFKNGLMRESAPVAWQDINGRRIPVGVGFRIYANGDVGFDVAPYNPAHELTIDPVMTWNTFLGSVADTDYAYGIALDSTGNVYVSGYSDGTWGTPVNPHQGGIDAFVAKLDGNGNPIWHTYLGAANDDWGYGVTLDTAGNLYAVGYSQATWGTPVNPHTGLIDAYVTRLDSTSGVRLWHTFMGSSGSDYAYSIVTDDAGSLFVSGRSDAGWGTPIQPYGGDMDVFVTRMDAETGSRTWNTFIGSTGTDFGYGLARDTDGNLLIGGRSNAGWGTPVNSHTNNGEFDAFVAKLSSNGIPIWHTYMGSTNFDYSAAVSVDTKGDVYLAGYSSGSWGDPLMPYVGDKDVFVAKLDGHSGTRLWHTFMGSTTEDYSSDLAMDAGGDIFVVGFSDETWGTPSNPHAGSSDGFAAKLDKHSGQLLWHTFNGSSGSDLNYAAVADTIDQLFIVGRSSNGWGTPLNAFSGGATEAFAAVLAPTYKLTVHLTGIGSGTVSGIPSSTICGDICSQELDQDTTATLIPTPDAGSTFSGWAGVGCAGGGDCGVTMNADRIFRAHFNNPALDSDDDGIGDVNEHGPGGNDITYDGNADGIPDWQQADVVSSHTADGANYLTYSVPQNVSISAAENIEKPLLTELPEEAKFDLGFFDFTVNDIAGGDAVAIAFRLPAGTAPTTYYKFGPTPDNPVDHWYEFLYDGTTGAVIAGDKITLHFKDGHRGDSDLDATNGIIVDPGGPGFTHDGTTPGGGSGCMIGTMQP